jgi:mono/diheme cytochrome c family protein
MRHVAAVLLGTGFVMSIWLAISPVGAVPSSVGPVPDARLTPGAADDKVGQENIAQTICRPGYTKSVRKISSTTKAKVFAEYKVSKTDRSKYTIDQLIPLELGGSTSMANLWPEPKRGNQGSRSKDALETTLHSLVCGGTMPLAASQTTMATDWTAAGTIAQGAQVFSAECARCHGGGGEGGRGPKLAGVVANDFPNAQDQVTFVTNHTKSPVFTHPFSAEQINHVVQYTRSLR